MSYGYYEDCTVGDTDELGSYLFTAEAIKAFAAKYDPQAFHLDEAAAEIGPFGRLTASGWHTASVMMKLVVERMKAAAERCAAEGLPKVDPGPSPGFEGLVWLKPVFAGDRLTYRSEVVDKRPLASRPEWGLAQQTVSAFNQDGEEVFRMRGKVLLRRRGAAAG